MGEDRILDRLDQLAEKQTLTLVALAQLQEQIKPVSDHEGRIRGLERWRWSLVGGLGLLATAFTTYASNKGM